MAKTLGVARDYGELVQIIDRRRCQLGLTHVDIDDRAGLGGGHYSHLISWRDRHGRSLGPSTLSRILSALGVGLTVVAVEDVEPGERDVAMVRTGPRRRNGTVDEPKPRQSRPAAKVDQRPKRLGGRWGSDAVVRQKANAARRARRAALRRQG